MEVFELRMTNLDEFQIYLGVGRRFAINPNDRHLGIYTKMAARTGPLRKNKETMYSLPNRKCFDLLSNSLI